MSNKPRDLISPSPPPCLHACVHYPLFSSYVQLTIDTEAAGGVSCRHCKMIQSKILANGIPAFEMHKQKCVSN